MGSSHTHVASNAWAKVSVRSVPILFSKQSKFGQEESIQYPSHISQIAMSLFVAPWHVTRSMNIFRAAGFFQGRIVRLRDD